MLALQDRPMPIDLVPSRTDESPASRALRIRPASSERIDYVAEGGLLPVAGRRVGHTVPNELDRGPSPTRRPPSRVSSTDLVPRVLSAAQSGEGHGVLCAGAQLQPQGRRSRPPTSQ